MYCDICRQPAEIVLYDTAGPSTAPQRVTGTYCQTHNPMRCKIVWCGAGGNATTITPERNDQNDQNDQATVTHPANWAQMF